MLINCYYRCPIIVEKNDAILPHFFVLGKVVQFNSLSNKAFVKLYDLLGSGQYYSEIFSHNEFDADTLCRCHAPVGSAAKGSWGTGKIAATIDEDESKPYIYYIKLKDGSYVKASEEEIELDYSQMDYSPAQQLKSYEFQNPVWFANHLKVSRTLHLMKNASYGFEVLAGCRAFLMPHQLTTIARCLETFPVRYMLADEVGLGKTVEACSIMKILMSEDQSFRTLIVVPGSLVGQWKNELHYKYALEAKENDVHSQVCIVSLDAITGFQKDHPASWNLMIVDETHRLLSDLETYETIQNLSKLTTHILLLSATPIQDRNEEYRKLLSLLTPEQYGKMSEKEFTSQVNKQKRIQQKINQQIGRLDRYEEYAESILNALEDIASKLDDRALNKLIAKVDLNAEDKGQDKIEQALSYICENYRIERHVIRNRRTMLKEKMAARELYECPYTPMTSEDLYAEEDVIEDVMNYLQENTDDSDEYITLVAIPLLNALFSSPWALEGQLKKLKIEDSLLLHSVQRWKEHARSEHSSVNEYLDDPDLIKGRLLRVMDYIDQETDIFDDPDFKLVVFSGFTETVNEFYELLNQRFSKDFYAVKFCKEMSKEELEDSVYAFQNDKDCRIIVCDETGGEGRNFQNASEIIHIDIPWNANNLEQRIGRLDRIGRSYEENVKSVVFYTKNTVESQLFHIWKDGMKIFEQSLSGLEIITGELNQLIIEALLDDFRNGLNRAYDDILDQAEEMRESVEDEQMFDIGATLYRPLSKEVENILSIYESEGNSIFASAMMSWGNQVGMVAEKPRANSVIEFKQERFEVNAAKQCLYIPPKWSNYTNSSIMKRTGKLLGTFNRKTAAELEDVLFFAPGDGVYDSIIQNAVGCSRGHCTATELLGPFHFEGLVYVFNVDVPICNLLDEHAGIQTLAHYRMFLPLQQIYVPIPFDKPSEQISESSVINLLLKARTGMFEHLGSRTVSRGSYGSPLERFMIRYPSDIWATKVDECTKKAAKIAKRKLLEEAEYKAALKEMHRIINGARAEALFFDRDMTIAEEKEKLYRQTYKALTEAKPVLDSVCYLRVVK